MLVLPHQPSSDAESQSQSSSFAFSVHSQDSTIDQASSNAEVQSAAKQRRRRTSPEDQAFLEAEYQRNPKPDKAARKHIVDQVALGEKEVQPSLPQEVFE
ncbi:MAG: hypothetical protein Q9190_007392 [Brigantiaea leucoxantha]